MCRVTPSLFEIKEQYRTLYVKTKVGYIVGGDIKSP